jgi:hypothetical protein
MPRRSSAPAPFRPRASSGLRVEQLESRGAPGDALFLLGGVLGAIPFGPDGPAVQSPEAHPTPARRRAQGLSTAPAPGPAGDPSSLGVTPPAVSTASPRVTQVSGRGSGWFSADEPGDWSVGPPGASPRPVQAPAGSTSAAPRAPADPGPGAPQQPPTAGGEHRRSPARQQRSGASPSSAASTTRPTPASPGSSRPAAPAARSSRPTRATCGPRGRSATSSAPPTPAATGPSGPSTPTRT